MSHGDHVNTKLQVQPCARRVSARILTVPQKILNLYPDSRLYPEKEDAGKITKRALT